MAKIDSLIGSLHRLKGDRLTFRTGAGVRLETGGESREVVVRPLSFNQIVGVLAEVEPDILRHLGKDGAYIFTYAAPSGRVQVSVERQLEQLRVVVVPDVDLEALPPEPPPEPPPPPKPAGPERLEVTLGEGLAGLLAAAVQVSASDLHLVSGCTPMARVDGELKALSSEPLDASRLGDDLLQIAPEPFATQYRRTHDADFAFDLAGVGRFRANLFTVRQGPGAVFRRIASEVPSAAQLGLPSILLDLCDLPDGLILVTGPTGSGKSTTLAALLDYINETRGDHIITIEDPIEFTHANKRGLVNQREVGVHTASFATALRAALREDPDVVMVGELRDLETMEIALKTAETGHLVLASMHTNNAPATVDRIIDSFPHERQAQVRQMLSDSLRVVASQRLCRRVGGGRVAAVEVLVNTSSVANLIREGKTHQLPTAMQTGRGQGMATLNDALADLVKRGVIDAEEALSRSTNRAELKNTLQKGARATSEGAAEGLRAAG